MMRKSIAWVLIVSLAFVAVLGVTQVLAETTDKGTGDSDSSSTTCQWSSFTFGADSWITSAPSDSILAEFSWQNNVYPAFVATQYGSGKAVFAPGSAFSQIDNITSPHNVRHELFLNSVKWVTRNKRPSQTVLLVTYGHSELLTYHRGGGVCCSSNVVQALVGAGYPVVVTPDIPVSLSGYDAVIMPGVGWINTPAYSTPPFWCGLSCHAPTEEETSTLLRFVAGGGGLVASVEYDKGANWMNPIGAPMNVTFDVIDPSAQQGTRVMDHPIFSRACRMFLPIIFGKPKC